MRTWSITDSNKLYNLDSWGKPYFEINDSGNMSVRPDAQNGPGVDMMKVMEDIRARGLTTPVLIRFQDITRHRVVTLNETFRKTMKEAGYQGTYKGVYPIKVNQMREVVEEILDAGEPYAHGLEAGSKAELAAVIAMDLPKDAIVILNGYKDYSVIKTALMGKKLGKNITIVVEKLTELEEVIRVAKEMHVRPLIGIRSKLYSKGSGKWEDSGGEFAKFGLTTPELIHAVNRLREEGMEDAFRLLHFHVGSQVANIRTIRTATKEATRIYSKLRKMGMEALDYLDVGGGLGVDYDGSRTDFDSSMNYSLSEYVSEIVYAIQEICEKEEVREPHIVSESGRAIVAHHSVLVVNVFGQIDVGSAPFELGETADEDDIVKEMRDVYAGLSNKKLLEHFHDALRVKEDALGKFNHGMLSLEDRAKVEHLFWECCKYLNKHLKTMKYVPDELENMSRGLARQYLCNFSVFQSMLDHWAIQHLFPIMPLHRHREKPSIPTTLADITCDSDGKISKFTDLRDIRDTLSLHRLEPGEPYYLGIFLMGAYQDIMGDLHNLFGRVHEVHVFLDEDEPEGYYIEEVIRGNGVSDVLSLVQYNAHSLQKQVKLQIDRKVREGVIKPREGVELQGFYEAVMASYTYMNIERPPAVPALQVMEGGTASPGTAASGSRAPAGI